MKKRIALFDVKPYDKDSFETLNKEFGFEISFFETRLEDTTAELAQGYEVVCAFVNDQISSKVIERLHEGGTRLIALRCAGYNNVDFRAAYGKINVTRVPAYSPFAVAEHAAALLLTLNRKVHRAYNRTREGNFSLNGLLGFDLHGRTAGVIGTGNIGQVFIKILQGFGMEILAHDPYPDVAKAMAEGFSYVPLDELLQRSQVISLHCPLTPETKYLINADSIERMRPGVIILNTSRGGLINSEALVSGLKRGKIGGAGLDVYEEEHEYFFEDHSATVLQDDILARLLTFPNVLVTSHQAFFTAEAIHNIGISTLTSIRDFFAGGNLVNEICYKCDGKCRKKDKQRCF